MTQPREKRDEFLDDGPRETGKPAVAPDREEPASEETNPSDGQAQKNITDQMSHADGSDQGAHPSDSEQLLGLNEAGRPTNANSAVE